MTSGMLMGIPFLSAAQDTTPVLNKLLISSAVKPARSRTLRLFAPGAGGVPGNGVFDPENRDAGIGWECGL